MLNQMTVVFDLFAANVLKPETPQFFLRTLMVKVNIIVTYSVY